MRLTKLAARQLLAYIMRLYQHVSNAFCVLFCFSVSRMLQRPRFVVGYNMYGMHTHTHTRLRPFSGTTRLSRCQKKKLLLDFIVQREISEADTPTIRTNQRFISLISSIFTPDALPAATLPVGTGTKYAGLYRLPSIYNCDGIITE